MNFETLFLPPIPLHWQEQQYVDHRDDFKAILFAEENNSTIIAKVIPIH